MIKKDVFEVIYEIPDLSMNITFGDPPYQLGTKYFINSNGEWDVKGNTVDFMQKWEGIHPKQWDKFMKEAFRFTKYGGYVVLYGMEENGAILNYYAIKNGFEVHQSLFWYQIEGMPKALNVSKAIDKKNNNKRRIIGKDKNFGRENDIYGKGLGGSEWDITVSNSELGKKYEGHYGGKKSLKPVIEQIFVFRKPLKSGSIVGDVLDYENGDNEISPACINHKDNLVPYKSENDMIPQIRHDKRNVNGGSMFRGDSMIKSSTEAVIGGSAEGRVPSQLFVDSYCAELLDNQSDKDQCSRILHICDYEGIEINGGDLVYFSSKVSKSEKNAGLDNFEEKSSGFVNASGRGLNVRCSKCGLIPYRKGAKEWCKCEEPNYQYIPILNKNNHPTPKPMRLNERILRLFKLPVEQNVFIPFGGSGSEEISAIVAGYKEENVLACEINEEYVEIANARKKYWKLNDFYFKKPKKEHPKQQKLCEKTLFDY